MFSNNELQTTKDISLNTIYLKANNMKGFTIFNENIVFKLIKDNPEHIFLTIQESKNNNIIHYLGKIWLRLLYEDKLRFSIIISNFSQNHKFTSIMIYNLKKEPIEIKDPSLSLIMSLLNNRLKFKTNYLYNIVSQSGIEQKSSIPFIKLLILIIIIISLVYIILFGFKYYSIPIKKLWYIFLSFIITILISSFIHHNSIKLVENQGNILNILFSNESSKQTKYEMPLIFLSLSIVTFIWYLFFKGSIVSYNFKEYLMDIDNLSNMKNINPYKETIEHIIIFLSSIAIVGILMLFKYTLAYKLS